MSKWTDSRDRGADIAYALTEDLDVLEHLKRVHESEDWTPGGED